MVRIPLPAAKTMSALSLMIAAGCAHKAEEVTPDWNRNTAAFDRTQDVRSLDAGSEAEKDALNRFSEFYAEYSAEAVSDGVRGLYAEDAWFGDPLHIVEGVDDIEHYFLVMAEPVESCTFSIDSVHPSDGDYFIRWTMELESSAAKGELIKTVGLSHVRFNDEGLIVFQQDYWDTSAMMDRLPVVGYWTRLVKTRIAKGLEE